VVVNQLIELHGRPKVGQKSAHNLKSNGCGHY
jgi:hypothetical protein